MRRFAIAGGVVLVGALGLAGCAASPQSYGVGYSVGQSMAAGSPGFTASDRVVAARCQRQWQISGSTIDSQREWVRGCVRGFLNVEAEVTSTTHP